jgi:hypothetical protein
VRAPPAIPKSTGAFNEFTYVLDPFEAGAELHKEQQRAAVARAAVVQAPMRAGGRVQRNEQLKAQVRFYCDRERRESPCGRGVACSATSSSRRRCVSTATERGGRAHAGGGSRAAQRATT